MNEPSVNGRIGVLLSVWGDVVVVSIDAAQTLEAMQRLTADGGLVTMVGGYITELDVPVDLWLDDEGLLKPAAQVNHMAGLFAGQRLVGNVLVLASDGEGETASLSPLVVDWFRSTYEVHGGWAGTDVYTVDSLVQRGEGVWWPTEAQRYQMCDEGLPVLAVPPPVVVPLADAAFEHWLDTGEVVT